VKKIIVAIILLVLSLSLFSCLDNNAGDDVNSVSEEAVSGAIGLGIGVVMSQVEEFMDDIQK
jgi:hypothetical protein